MYNGIGLQTARGSGTNGYVQRNLSLVRHTKDKVNYKSEEEIKKLDAEMARPPNEEILAHERKRKVELKCMEMQELMEDQGYTDEEIDRKVSTFRKMLMEKEGVSEKLVDRDSSGRPIVKNSHQVAEASQAKNDALRAALGISEYFVEGSSFDPNRKAKEESARALEMAQKKYAILEEEKEGKRSRGRSVSPASSRSPSPSRDKKRRKKSKHGKHKSTKRADSQSRDRKHKKAKKSRSSRPNDDDDEYV
ncbi:hypothetical protein CAPTEDRAFT_176903 [Capitella teleta]|uniref:CWF21 domain-containing protein n=1 Tax=Capitella teleta TaxID=283909 RepID=R7U6I4_CAPTE|nr:hypothetical protein CAPTEDRAFT_176903 [Capitella teleta]|eukprot:ELT98755.1 hypothetical protein CAPTEDRAFT_176903 [Capitella teleta]